MARLFDDASAEALEVDTAVVTVEPFSISAWFYKDDGTVSADLVALVDKDVGTQYHRLRVHSDETVRARSQNAGNNTQAITTTSATLNTWQHACGVWPDIDTRNAYLNGGGLGADGGSPEPTGLDRTSIGRLGRDSPDAYFPGRIAEVAIWNVGLTSAEVSILAAGYSPLFVRADSLVAYWPLIGRHDPEIDLIGGLNLSLISTPVPEAHPPIIYYPVRPIAIAAPSVVLVRPPVFIGNQAIQRVANF